MLRIRQLCPEPRVHTARGGYVSTSGRGDPASRRPLDENPAVLQYLTAAFLLASCVLGSLLFAFAARAAGLGTTLLIAYVALVAQVIALVTVLSPGRHVTRAGLVLGEPSLLAAAAIFWWLRGRPRPALAPARALLRVVCGDRLVAAFSLVVGVSLAYELLLVLSVPPNNWDSLTYHLSRAAAWAQHGGLYWIPNAPTDRMNEFQSIAEQGVLFLFAGTGSTALFALPQFVAQLAIIAAIYQTARMLGYDRRSSACAALLFASFSLVALEATTAQNDLVAASLPVAAAALLLTGGGVEAAVAGVAIGLGIGVKLTTLLVLPIVLALAIRLGRRRAALFGVTALISFMALGMWGFVLNYDQTGHLLGHGGGRVEFAASPSPRGVLLTGFRALFKLPDLSGFGIVAVTLTAFAALVVVVALLHVGRRASGVAGSASIARRVAPALPLLAPVLVLCLAAVAKAVDLVARMNVNDPAFSASTFRWRPVTGANEDVSGFGPFGGLALLVAAVSVPVLAARRRSLDPRIVLGLSLPVFVIALSLQTKYNPWLDRFLIVPVALTTPLLAFAFRRRAVTLAIVVVASLTLVLAHVNNELKPLHGRYGAPWQLTRTNALRLTWRPEMGTALARLDRQVPADACIGAILGGDEPAFILYGPDLRRRVRYLEGPSAVGELRWVVLGGVTTEPSRSVLRREGWQLERLAGAWYLASRPRVSRTGCPEGG
jgi:hypothetical protein